jgi:hypothetical protein
MKAVRRSRAMKRSLYRFVPLAAFVVLVSSTPPAAYAFHYYSKCGSKATVADHEIHLGAGTNSFPEGKRRDALLAAQTMWNNAPGNFHYSTPDWGEGVGRNNQDDEIWFTDDHDQTGGKPSMAHLTFGCYLSEVDIIFYDPEKWSYTDQQFTKITYGGDYRPWITGALHELGHGFGLAHVNSEYNIMGSDSTHVTANDGKIKYYAGEDGADGQVYLYGLTDYDAQDIGVTHWKYGGHDDDSEYSDHVLTRITHPDLAVPTTGFEGVRRYEVFDDFDYDVEFTYENNGRDFQSDIDVGFYISTNPLITTNDVLIKTATFNLGRDDVSTFKKRVHIPQLTSGQTYWLGVIVDRTKKIAEFNESNNATYLPIRVFCCN